MNKTIAKGILKELKKGQRKTVAISQVVSVCFVEFLPSHIKWITTFERGERDEHKLKVNYQNWNEDIKSFLKKWISENP